MMPTWRPSSGNGPRICDSAGDGSGSGRSFTGSGAGIGREAALLFAKKGAKVVVNSVTPANGEETLRLIREAGGEGIYICADVSQESETKRIIDETMQTYGRIDVLVNNAGIVLGGTVDTTTLADYQRTMDVNVKSVLMLSLLVIPIMRAQGGGCIVNTASVLASKGVKDRLVYSASKGAVVSLSRAMAAELIRENIRVNCVSPGSTLTPSMQSRIDNAKAIVFAADDEAGFMNGQDLHIDGGALI